MFDYEIVQYKDFDELFTDSIWLASNAKKTGVATRKPEKGDWVYMWMPSRPNSPFGTTLKKSR